MFEYVCTSRVVVALTSNTKRKKIKEKKTIYFLVVGPLEGGAR